MTDDRVQQDLIPAGDDNGEAKYAPLPASDLALKPETDDAASPQMALEPSEIEIKFTELPDETIIGEVPAFMGKAAYTFKLQNMNWGLFEDIEAMQHADDADRMGTMLKFLMTYVVGGPKAVPLKHTRTIFEAITSYASISMDSSKN